MSSGVFLYQFKEYQMMILLYEISDTLRQVFGDTPDTLELLHTDYTGNKRTWENFHMIIRKGNSFGLAPRREHCYLILISSPAKPQSCTDLIGL